MEVPTIISTFRALKANPVPMAFGEIYSGLQSGVIDACESSFLSWINSKHFEVAKYGIQLNYMDSGRSYMANQKIHLDHLDPKLRNAIEQAMTETIVIIVREYKSQDTDALKTAKRVGAEILTPDLKPFVAAVQPVYKQFTPTLGLKMIETIQKAQ